MTGLELPPDQWQTVWHGGMHREFTPPPRPEVPKRLPQFRSRGRKDSRGCQDTFRQDAILRHLATKPRTVAELAVLEGIGMRAIHSTLARMRPLGKVMKRFEKRVAVYSLARSRVKETV